MSATLTIPGVETVHPREAWEPGSAAGVWTGAGTFRMDSDFHRTPSGLHLPSVDRAAIHYTSAIDIPDGDPDEILTGIDGIRRLLARSTTDYYSNRDGGGYKRLSDGKWFNGYPLGYSFAVDWLGGVWVIRGFDYVPAATSGHNGHTIAILMLTDRADPGSDLMWKSARAIQRECKRRGAPIANRPWAHGWFKERTGRGTATACCGPALKAQIEDGQGDIDYVETPPPVKPTPPTEPTPPVEPEDPNMKPTHLKWYPGYGFFHGVTLLLLTDDDGINVTKPTADGRQFVTGGVFDGVEVTKSDPKTDIQWSTVLHVNGPETAFRLGQRGS